MQPPLPVYPYSKTVFVDMMRASAAYLLVFGLSSMILYAEPVQAECGSATPQQSPWHTVQGEWQVSSTRDGNVWNSTHKFVSADLLPLYGADALVFSEESLAAPGETATSFVTPWNLASERVIHESELQLFAGFVQTSPDSGIMTKDSECAPEAVPASTCQRANLYEKTTGQPVCVAADPINVVFHGGSGKFISRLDETGWTEIGGPLHRCGQKQWIIFHEPNSVEMKFIEVHLQMEDVLDGCLTERSHLRIWHLTMLNGEFWTIANAHHEHSHCNPVCHHRVHDYENTELDVGGNFCGAAQEFKVQMGGYFLGNEKEEKDHEDNVFRNSAWALFVIAPGKACTNSGL